jgi:hypothetical protein
MVEVYGNTHAVDIPEDVKTVEGILNEWEYIISVNLFSYS